MPNPTVGDVHVNAALTNISVAFGQSEDTFVARRVFSQVPVRHKSDEFFVLDREDWFRSDARERAPGTESAGSGWRVSTQTYHCTRNALPSTSEMKP